MQIHSYVIVENDSIFNFRFAKEPEDIAVKETKRETFLNWDADGKIRSFHYLCKYHCYTYSFVKSQVFFLHLISFIIITIIPSKKTS